MPVITDTGASLPDLMDFKGVRIRKWTGMTTGDTGSPVVLTKWNDRTLHVTGTFSGATVTFEGSNDGIEYLPMRDVFNVVVSATEAKLITLTEVPLYVRPSVSGGTSPSITVIVAGVGHE